MRAKEKYKISVITPALNSEQDIESCIRSVADQNYNNKEHIIIDGASTDKTLCIVKNLMKKYPHIRYVSEKDDGIYDAMNKGISMSSGDWLYFLGSDDVFYNNDVLEEIFVKKDLTLCDVVYGNVEWGNTGIIYDHKFSLLKLMEKNICHQAIFFSKQLFLKMGKFEIKYKILADYVFNIKWFNEDNIKRLYIDNIIAKYNIDGRSGRQNDEIFASERDLIISKYFPEEYNQLRQKVSDIQQVLREKENVILEMKQAIYDLRHSFSWKITHPFRWVHLKNVKLYNIFSCIRVCWESI